MVLDVFLKTIAKGPRRRYKISPKVRGLIPTVRRDYTSCSGDQYRRYPNLHVGFDWRDLETSPLFCHLPSPPI